MSFGFTNANATFQEITDIIFQDEEHCMGYMDDTLIYGGTSEAEQQPLVSKVL